MSPEEKDARIAIGNAMLSLADALASDRPLMEQVDSLEGMRVALAALIVEARKQAAA